MTSEFSVGPRVRHLVLALLGLLVLGLAQINLGEILPVGEGQGWDGRTYVGLAQQFPHAVFEEGVDAYRLRRVLPSGLVYLILAGLDLGRDASVVRDVFAAYNLAMLALTLLAWFAMVRSLRLGTWSFWLGYVLLFFSFANLKMPFYYSPLTDTTALALGAWLLTFHLRSQPVAALLVLAAGAFTWPSFLVFGAPLCACRRAALPVPESKEGLGSLLGVVSAGLFVLGFLLRVRPVEIPAPAWLALGLPLCLAYLFLVSRGLFGGIPFLRRSTWVDASSGARMAALVAVGLTILTVSRLAARGEGFTSSYFIDHAIGYSLAKPGLFLVSHAVYFGLVVPLGLVLWPRVCEAAHELGVGVTLYLAAHLLWGVHPESRQLIDGLPALVLAVVLAARSVRWPPWGVFAMAGLGLVASKIWLPLNHDGFQGRSDPFSYPAQYYFMNHGPWMNDVAYLFQGAIVLLLTVGLHLGFRAAGTGARPAAEPAMTLPPQVQRGAVWMAGLLILAGCVEGLARLALSARAYPERNEASRPDPVLGWRNQAKSVLRVRGSDYEVDLRFNDRGLRGPEAADAKAPGVRRVLLMGGSQVEGYNVPEEATVRALIGTSLRDGEHPVEVLNAGVAGYATDQAYLAFISDLRRYEPDDILLFVSAEDMYLNTTNYLGKPLLEFHTDGSVDGPTPFQPVALPRRGPRADTTLRFRGSAALRLISDWTAEAHPAWHRRLSALGIVERTEPPAALSAYGLGERDRVWQQLRGVLQAFRAHVHDSQRLVVVYVPAPFEIDDALWAAYADRYDLGQRPWDRNKVADRLNAICARLEVPLVDLRPALRARFEGGEPLYLHGEPLWSAAGHATVAREVVRFLGGAR